MTDYDVQYLRDLADWCERAPRDVSDASPGLREAPAVLRRIADRLEVSTPRVLKPSTPTESD